MKSVIFFSKTALLAVLIIKFVESSKLAIEVEAVISHCCHVGSKRFADFADKSSNCSIFNANQTSINVIVDSYRIREELHTLCISSMQYCCQKKFSESSCEKGIECAKGSNCFLSDESDSFKLCHLACIIGRQMSEAGGKCNFDGISHFDKIKMECCKNFNSFNENFEVRGVEYEDDDKEEDTTDEEEDVPCDDGHQCPHECFIRKGKAKCETLVCGQGFERNSEGNCEDIDECALDNNTCQEMKTCVNTNGSYICKDITNSCPNDSRCGFDRKNTCPNGYEFSAATNKCIDINECLFGGNRCNPYQLCVNRPGSYYCKPKNCREGYILNDLGGCDDIDECLSKKCGYNMECRNYPGSYKCECKNGFKLDDRNPTICHDIDECFEKKGICSQRCHNTYGSYVCSCHFGYRMGKDNQTCFDIDECDRKDGSLCLGGGYCQNTLGSYICSCPSGLTLDGGRYCEDIDECIKTPGTCADDEKCLNLRGSYKCIKKRPQCDPGYRSNIESCYLMDRTKCYRDENTVEGACQIPSIYKYIYIHVVANCTVGNAGRDIIAFSRKKNTNAAIKSLKIIHAGDGIKIANNNYFHLDKTPERYIIKILKPLDGPQELELDVWFNTKGLSSFGYILASRIVIFVSEFSY